jgi:hypothetical protein
MMRRSDATTNWHNERTGGWRSKRTARGYLLIDFFDDSVKNSTSTQRPNFDVF